MVDRSWNGTASGSWSVSTRWVPSGIPTSADNCFIGANVTVSVGSLSSCRNLTIGATVTFSCSSTLQVNGTFDNYGTVRQIGAGAIAMVGSLTPVDIYPGDNNFTNFRVAKTSSTNEVYLNGQLNVLATGAGATTGRFAHAGGRFYQNYNTIECNIYDQSSTTTRQYYLTGDVNVRASSGIACSGNSTALDYLEMNGRVGVFPQSGSTTVTVGFGADKLSAPNVLLGNNRNFACSGHVRDIELNGAFVSTTNVSIWGSLTGTPTTSSMITGVTVNQFAETNNFLTWDYNTQFGTVGFSIQTGATGVTFDLVNLKANTINCNAVNTTFNITVNASATPFTTFTLNCLGSGSTYNYNYIRDSSGTSTTINMGGGTTSVHWLNDVDILGNINFSIGTMELTNWVYCRTFNSTSGSNRTFQFNYNWLVINGSHRSSVNGNGFFQITGSTSLFSDAEQDDGGWRLQATGSSTFGTWSENQAPRLVVESRSGTLSPVISSGNIRSLFLENSISFSSATTISIIREGFGWNEIGALNLTQLNIQYIHAVGQTLDYRPASALTNANYRLGTFTIPIAAGNNQTWNINVYANNIVLTKAGGNFYLDDINFTGSVTCSGSGSNYYYGTLRNDSASTTSEQIIMSGGSTTLHAVVWYDINLTGIINFSIGTLRLDWALECRVFRSTSGSTRVINFQNNPIVTKGTGYFDVTGTTSMTTDVETSGGYFIIRGTGTSTIGNFTTYNAPTLRIEPQGGSLTTSVSGHARELILGGGTLTLSSNTSGITLVRYGMYDEGGTYNLTGLYISLGMGTDESFNYTNTVIGNIQSTTEGGTGRTYSVIARCTTLNLNTSLKSYNLDDVEFTSTCNLYGQATYNCNNVRASAAATNPSINIGNQNSGVFNLYSFVSTVGTVTYNYGTINVTSGLNQFLNWTSQSGATRVLNFQGNYIQLFGNLTMGSSPAGFSSDTNGGFEIKNNSVTVNLAGIVSTNANAFNIKYFKNITVTTNSTVKDLVFGGAPGCISAATINVRGSVLQQTPYDGSNPLSNLTINMVGSGTYDADTPSQVGNVNCNTANQNISFTNIYAVNLNLGAGTAYFSMTNCTGVTTTTCSGGGSTYNFAYLIGTTLSIGAISGTINLGQVDLSGTTSGLGFQWNSLSNATLNVTGLSSIARFESAGSSGKTINFGTNYIGIKGSGNVIVNVSAGTTVTTSGGGWQALNGATFDITTSGSTNAMNLVFEGSVTLSNSNYSWFRNLRNHSFGSTVSPGRFSNTSITITVWGDLDLASDGTSAMLNWNTITVDFLSSGTQNIATSLQSRLGWGQNIELNAVTMQLNGTRTLIDNFYVKSAGTVTFSSGTLNLETYTFTAGTWSLNNSAKTVNSGTSGKIVTTNWDHANVSSMVWNGSGYVEINGGTLKNGSTGVPAPIAGITNFRIVGTPTFDAGAFYAGNVSMANWDPAARTYYIAGNITYEYGTVNSTNSMIFDMVGTANASINATNVVSGTLPKIIISGGKTVTVNQYIVTNSIQINSSNTLNTNNVNLDIYGSMTVNGTITLGSSVVTIEGSGTVWDMTATASITAGNTAEIKFTGNSDKTAYFGRNQTIYKVTNSGIFTHSANGEGTGWLTIQSDNLTIDTVGKYPGAFSAGFKFTNQGLGVAKVTTLNISGSAANRNYVQGPITKPGTTGAMSFSYLGIKNSVVSGGEPPGWYAENSIDYGGNTGWIFAGGGIVNNGNGFFVFF